MIDKLIRLLIEDDDEEVTWKDTEHVSRETAWPESYAGPSYLYDENGREVSKSRNLAGIRRYVSRRQVQAVHIQKLEHGEGGIRIEFVNGWYWLGRFADYGVLKWTLRNWKNIQMAPLVVDGNPSGLVSYHNLKLIL